MQKITDFREAKEAITRGFAYNATSNGPRTASIGYPPGSNAPHIMIGVEHLEDLKAGQRFVQKHIHPDIRVAFVPIARAINLTRSFFQQFPRYKGLRVEAIGDKITVFVPIGQSADAELAQGFKFLGRQVRWLYADRATPAHTEE
ncbi:MAG: hypothetical protein JNN11_00690 [Candidatus Doudnabacteria bacterium]|nr:hypothetical protein [Candidatus Doudnabacteria bacterium]